ncbi:MAG TPA: helix-turn-helix transcriptional regulator [Saprospiraceae bacterium]|nr:helix-turn-helix transcriptional regulator [Saprospiraceae bacterium]
MMNIGQKIRQVRISRGLTQEKLAEGTGLSIRTIQRLEAGSNLPYGDTLIRLSGALDVPLDYFMGSHPIKSQGYPQILLFSALLFLYHPAMGLLITWLLWMLRKHESQAVDQLGLKLVRIELIWLGLFYALVLIRVPAQLFSVDLGVFRLLQALIRGDGSWPVWYYIAIYLIHMVILTGIYWRVQSGGNITQYRFCHPSTK